MERGERRERRGKKICNNNEINKTFSNHPFFFRFTFFSN